MRFVGDGYVIDLTLGVISKGDVQITLRAKTLQVLQMLLQHRGSTVSKADMLAQIWAGLVVQEQVLVQSVKELRDALQPNVIQTYPKHGYRWIAAGRLVGPLNNTDLAPLNNTDLVSTASPLTSAFASTRWWRFWPAALLLLCVLLWQPWRTQPVAQRSIAVLPVVNLLQDKPYQAVSLQGQQYLIGQLQAAQQLQENRWHLVMTDEIAHQLELLGGDELNQLTQGDFFALRQQLTADVIVSTRLLGYPQDFQLQYTLSLPYSSEKGVVFADTVEGCFSKLAVLLAQRFALTLDSTNQPVFQHDLTNASLVAGINYYLQADFANAVALLSSSLVTAPELLATRRYLASSYANLGQRQQAIDLLRQGLQLASNSDEREWYRTALLLGVLLAEQANGAAGGAAAAWLLQSEQQLQLALGNASKQHDMLFQVFSHEELARVKRLQQQFAAAQQHLQQALELHQQLSVPYGQTNTLIELARLAMAQQQLTVAAQYLDQAWQLALTHQVSANQVWVLLAQAELASLTSPGAAATYIGHAQQVAGQSRDPLLQQRVSRWQQHNASRLLN